MAVGRNTILTLHKKVRIIFASWKSCIFTMKLFGRWLESSRKLVKHATDQARQKTNSPNKALCEKYVWKAEKEFPSFCFGNRNQSNFKALNPQRRPQNLSLQNAEKAWIFNHSWTYETWQMSTHSESNERWNGA